ncbi:MAG: hypothetical protein P8Q16_02205 [Flavobacteriales bacterium]|jgi:hypothetical protein|nr:hypothetical protein [Flavobacteriales bacterium]MDG1439551.1 hypothetical protein [Flavobacteriales bacterium]
MKEFNFSTIENLSKDLNEGIVKLNNGNLSTKDIQPLLIAARLLHERLSILQYLAEKKDQDSSETESQKETEKIEENQINLIDVIVEEEAKTEKVEPLTSSKSVNEMHSNSPQTSLADQFGQQPIIDLNKEIGINERYLMTENLFGGDSQECTNAIHKLNEFENLVLAQDYLKKELSQKFNWSTKSNQVKRLFKLVERRYQTT